jgi:hypothetical protein
MNRKQNLIIWSALLAILNMLDGLYPGKTAREIIDILKADD